MSLQCLYDFVVRPTLKKGMKIIELKSNFDRVVTFGELTRYILPDYGKAKPKGRVIILA